MTGSRSLEGRWIFYPSAGRLGVARDLQQYKELLRISVLSFIENDVIIVFANTAHHLRKPHEFASECYLVRILDETALKSEFAVIALHFISNTESVRIDPITKRSKRITPNPHKFFCRRSAGRPRNKLICIAPPLFPAFQLGFGLCDVR